MADCPRTGMWADDTVPRRGWRYSDIDVDPDLAPFMKCQMCSSEDPGVMLEYFKHENYPRLVAAGQCCGYFMEYGPDWEEPSVEADPEPPIAQAAAAPSPPPVDEVEAHVTAIWDRVAWKDETRFDAMQSTADVEGIVVRVRPVGPAAYKIHLTRFATGEAKAGNIVFPTIEEAKAGALKAVVWGLKNLTREPKNLLQQPETLLHKAIDLRSL